MIRPVHSTDAAALCAIYNYYIEQTVVSFEQEPVSPADMEKRILTITAKYPWLVYEDAGTVLGYAYINTWRERYAYRFSVEDSIYLKRGCEGRGIGTALLSALLNAARARDIHAIIAGITVPNERSARLHEAFGFKQIALFNAVGYKMNQWLDVGYWELVL
jgi:phosphinothricin acetyltransferase